MEQAEKHQHPFGRGPDLRPDPVQVSVRQQGSAGWRRLVECNREAASHQKVQCGRGRHMMWSSGGSVSFDYSEQAPQVV